MSKIRSLLIFFALCVAVGIVWMVSASRGSATLVDGPNLSVRSDVLGSQWVVRDENIPAEACSAIEGEVTPGLRKLVRFTVMTPNTGNQDIFVGDPNDHVAADDGLFELATCHNHFHFRHYALYELVDPRTGRPVAETAACAVVAPTATDIGRHVIMVRPAGGATAAAFCIEPSGRTFIAAVDGASALGFAFTDQTAPFMFNVTRQVIESGGTVVPRGVPRQIVFAAGGNGRFRF